MRERFADAALIPVVRVSKKGNREGDRFHSPTDQLNAMRAWADSEGARLLDPVEEIDQSGGDVARPKFEAAMRMVESGFADGIVVARIDRLTRSLLFGRQTIDRLRACGGVFYALDAPAGIGGADDDFSVNFLLLIAEWQRKRLRAGFRQGCQTAVESLGIHIAPVPNFGYAKDPDTRRFVPHETNAGLVTELFERAAEGTSWADLARWLDGLSIRTSHDNGWSSRAVKDLVRNRVYLGEAKKGPFFNPAAHPPLVDLSTFERAQRRGRRPAFSDRPPRLLAGLVRCAGCRYGMGSYAGRDSVRVFHCRGAHQTGRCPAPASIRAPDLERFVEFAFWEMVESHDVTDRDLAEARRIEVERCQAEIERYRSLRLQRLLGDAWEAGLEERAIALLAAERSLASCSAVGLPDAAVMRREWPSMSVEDQGRMLSAVIGAVFVRRATRRGGGAEAASERATVVAVEDLDTDLPRRGRTRGVVIRSFEPVGL